ncbi:hypothetical protein MSAN_01703300 [Mycena sanguinolenta]|uniref:Uncharacterized protein n=1 Tax=Mycena sanguinolenta TaxID=230812 RepID=A0A8H6Y0I6_9AGAR|nr:hypothetical protein MSAN_01703300 [Mycena sanguinolenta]
MKTESTTGNGHFDDISAAVQALAETAANAQKAANADKIRADLALAESQRECADLKAKVKCLGTIIEQQRQDLKAADSRLADVERERKILDAEREKLSKREDNLKVAEATLQAAKASFTEEKKQFAENQRVARVAVADIRRAAQTLENRYSAGEELDAPVFLPNRKRVKVCLSSDDESDAPASASN